MRCYQDRIARTVTLSSSSLQRRTTSRAPRTPTQVLNSYPADLNIRLILNSYPADLIIRQILNSYPADLIIRLSLNSYPADLMEEAGRTVRGNPGQRVNEHNMNHMRVRHETLSKQSCDDRDTALAVLATELHARDPNRSNLTRY